MTGPEVLDVAREAIYTLVIVSAPVMLVGLAVGVAISLLQALTQIQEMTLAFVPKILAIFVSLLIALPLLASVAVGTPTGVIEAASVLPATCIVPALALYEIGVFFGHLPIVFDRMTGARIFTNPEQIGRLLLLLFLVVSTLRTFFWYFEATLPNTTSNQFQPSFISPATGPVVAHVISPKEEAIYGVGTVADWHAELPSAANAGIVLVRVSQQPLDV